MMTCARCEVLPAALASEGVLFVAPPLGHTLRKVQRVCSTLEHVASQPTEGVLRIEFRPGQLPRLLEALGGDLSRQELIDARCLLCGPDVVPGLADFMRMEHLSELVGRSRADWLLELMGQDRLTTFFQPIVSATDTSQIFGYECLLRGSLPSGAPVSPTTLFEAGRAAGLLFQLDRAARLTAIASAHAAGIVERLFINFIPTAIYDPTFCLRTTVEAMEKVHIRPDQVVFEVVESEEVHDPKHLLNIVRYYRDRGFRVALDDMGAGYSSLQLLHQLRPDFIKLDMDLIRGIDRDPYKASVSRKMLELATDLGVSSIGEGVETEGEFHWLRDHGVNLLQGFLFARPRPHPQTVASLS